MPGLLKTRAEYSQSPPPKLRERKSHLAARGPRRLAGQVGLVERADEVGAEGVRGAKGAQGGELKRREECGAQARYWQGAGKSTSEEEIRRRKTRAARF